MNVFSIIKSSPTTPLSFFFFLLILASMDTPSPDWSTLPEHLLHCIAKRLQTRIDTLRFRAVCKSFRSSTAPPSKPFSPRSDIKIQYPLPLTPYRHGNLLLAESTIYAVESLDASPQTTETWLLKLEELSSGKVRVGDPLFKLCSEKFSQMLPNSFNLLDYRVKEITKVYRLELESNKFDPSCFRKVAVSNENELELGVMALVTGGKVGLWRSKNKTWTNIDLGGNVMYFEDVTYHNKKFFAMGSDGRTITIDPKSLKIIEVAAAVTKSNHGLLSLIRSFDDLFLIDKYWLEKFNKFGLGSDDEFCSVRVDVYRLDEERREWIKVRDGLEEKALFLGENHSFFVEGEGFSWRKGGCIYLFDRDFSRLDFDYPAVSVVTFELEDDNGGWSYGVSSFSKIFWPPPTWLKQN
ncbi:F-box protein SKIP23-like [Pistacia vera]|uniref:F-box protein SKIP23-like n=1 Tax=Pistacia vera TaxID=55513 RepID=UPI00126324E0|nr:F-box protein SKIP23-like [Pistacia vera]